MSVFCSAVTRASSRCARARPRVDLEAVFAMAMLRLQMYGRYPASSRSVHRQLGVRADWSPTGPRKGRNPPRLALERRVTTNIGYSVCSRASWLQETVLGIRRLHPPVRIRSTRTVPPNATSFPVSTSPASRHASAIGSSTTSRGKAQESRGYFAFAKVRQVVPTPAHQACISPSSSPAAIWISLVRFRSGTLTD